MKAETKKKIEFLMEMGLAQNEINELMCSQSILDRAQEEKDFKKMLIDDDEEEE